MAANDALAAPFLHVARFDFEAGYEDECIEWLDERFIPATLESTGWLTAQRYRCLSGEPRELVLYGMPSCPTDSEVSVIPLAHPVTSRRMRNYAACTYEMVLQQGDTSTDTALINVVTTRVHRDQCDAFDSWYSNTHVPEIVACPGWLNSRRYHRIDAPASFLAIYELTDASTPFATPEYEAAVGWDGFDRHLLGYHGFRIFERAWSTSK